MQISSKLLRTAILVLVLMIALGLYLSLSLGRISTAKGVVSACSGSDWAKVQCYVDKYIQSQATTAGYGGGSNIAGKSGYFIDRSTQSDSLQPELDSNNDGTILGEGDDLAKAPVLVDNLAQLTTMIPGTSFRCIWNSATANCFDPGAVADVKTLVNDHEAATGQVPDIVDYCMTDHTEAPTVGGWGYIAQTGGLATDGSIPKVYGLTYGRDGWTNMQADTYSNANPIMPFSTSTTYTPPSTVAGSCNSSGGDANLVRCAAEWSITTGASYGNAGNGLSPATTAPFYTGGTSVSTSQVVDIRSGLPAGEQTINNNNGGTPAINDPIGTVFNTGLPNVDDNSGDTIIVASASQNTGGMVAEGLTMLGYHVTTKTTATANSPFGGYTHGGVDFYNNTLAGVEQNTAAEGSSCPSATTYYPADWDCLQSVTAWTAYGDTDTTPPTISTSSASSTGDTTATVSRTVSTPATTKIDLTGSDSSTVHVNNTILHASDTENLTGLHPGVTYTGTLTVYDSQALSTSTPISFTTSGIACAKPALSLSPPHAYWSSASDYTSGILSVDWTINNGATSPNAVGVQITGSASNNGVTVNSGIPSAAANIASGGSATMTVTYNIPAGTAWFHTSLTASATDECGNSYTYP